MIRSSRFTSAAALGSLLIVAAPVNGQTATPWQQALPVSLVQTGTTSEPALAEASGAAASKANPGLFWTVGDSGNPPELLAIDTTGALIGSFTLESVPNRDWEAVSVGPCGDSTCVYIADTGDNGERRDNVAIHRLVEPEVDPGSRQRITAVETLHIKYQHGPHDVEAMGVLPDGTILLVTKGRSGGVLAYELPAEAWRRGGGAVAVRTDSLPIDADLRNGRLVTDLAIDPTGRRVAVRTYRDVYLFTRDSTGRHSPQRACDILGAEPQGEGITWLPDGRLLLVSERGMFKRGSINILQC